MKSPRIFSMKRVKKKVILRIFFAPCQISSAAIFKEFLIGSWTSSPNLTPPTPVKSSIIFKENLLKFLLKEDILMGKGRDKKKKKKLANNPDAADAKKQRKQSQGDELKKSKKSKFLESSDDEDIDAIIESFKAKVRTLNLLNFMFIISKPIRSKYAKKLVLMVQVLVSIGVSKLIRQLQS